ncbi:MAG: CarD family transcriptional regulator [Clostridiales bacterium]|jgi:CarD family transcriptional regulator|nr:CarD family transcriptional regulator [Clostridiales bacterium]
MFCKGDKVVYPMYGAGVIEDLEELGSAWYYVINILVQSLQIKVSVEKAETCGIRPVYPKEEITGILLSGRCGEEPENRRYMERIKSGLLPEIFAVFRDLSQKERGKVLSGAEKKMLTTAKQIIVSEIAVSHNIEKNAAEEILLGAIG